MMSSYWYSSIICAFTLLSTSVFAVELGENNYRDLNYTLGFNIEKYGYKKHESTQKNFYGLKQYKTAYVNVIGNTLYVITWNDKLKKKISNDEFVLSTKRGWGNAMPGVSANISESKFVETKINGRDGVEKTLQVTLSSSRAEINFVNHLIIFTDKQKRVVLSLVYIQDGTMYVENNKRGIEYEAIRAEQLHKKLLENFTVN